MSKQITAPIHINLNGEYVIPINGQTPVAGSVSGDLRLAAFDAFLQGLDGHLKDGSAAAALLSNGFKQLRDGLTAKTLRDNDVELVVRSVINPHTQSLEHTIRLAVVPKAESV